MKHFIPALAMLLLSTTANATVTSSNGQNQLPQQRKEALPSTTVIDACFTPGDNCEQRIIDEIKNAKKFILIQAYSFTSAPIAKAILEKSKQKNMIIEIVLDKSQMTDKYSAVTFFKNKKVLVYVDDKHEIAHNKTIIIDGTTLITGSYNFTNAAQNKNAENIIIVKNNNQLLNKYIANSLKHRQHSKEIK